MKLVTNTSIILPTHTIDKGMVYNFEPGDGGELICRELKWIVSDPCLALWAFRRVEAPTPPAYVCKELIRQYKDYSMKDGDVSGLLGAKFKVLCWNPIPGEFNKDQIYEVEIMDLYGSGTDGFVSWDGYIVDTAQDAVNHFILAT